MWRSQISCVRAVFARHASATLGSRVFAIALAVADADSSPNGHDAPSSAPFVVPNGSCSRCRSGCRSSNSSASGVSAPNNRPKQRIRTDGYLARMDVPPGLLVLRRRFQSRYLRDPTSGRCRASAQIN